MAATLGNQFDIAVVDAKTGQVVLDSRRPQRISAPLGVPDDHRFPPIVVAGTTQGLRSIGDHPAAYQRLRRLSGNANDWYVIAAARAPVGPLYGVSGWSVALVVLALALLAFAAVSFLAHQRILVAHSLAAADQMGELALDLGPGRAAVGGQVGVSHEVVVELIAATRTRSGLRVHAGLDRDSSCGPDCYPCWRYLAGGMPTSRLKALRNATSES